MITIFINEIKTLIGKKLTLFLYFIFSISTLVALFDVISISSVAIFFGAILEPDKFLTDYLHYNFINYIYNLDTINRVVIGSFIILLIFFIKNFFSLLFNYLNFKLGRAVKNHISKKLFKSYISRDYYFHLNNNPSKIWHNVTNESHLVCNYAMVISQLFSSIILVIGIIALIIASSNFIFFLIFLFLSSIVFLIYYYFKRQIKIRADKRIFFDTNISKIVNHALGSIKETKIFNNENLFTHAFNESVTKREDQNFYINIINSLPRIILEILSIAVLLSIFIFLVFQDKSVTEILPFIALVTLSIIRLIPVFTNMTVQINTLKFYEVSKKIVLEEFKFFDKKHKQSKKPLSKLETFKSLKISKLNFSYVQKKNIIKNLNLNIIKKDKILFVGSSGTGKSTIVNLILGLLKPTSGSIKINGKDLDNVLDQWHKKIGFIPQDIYLLDDTIKKNIIYNSDNFNEKLFYSAIKQSKLDKELKKFSKGVNTKIGHMGKKLSGGQKQRIALARALYRNPEILIMDEPTSSLDEKSELKILKEFLDASKEITVIMVAHRVSKFERKFNKILKLS